MAQKEAVAPALLTIAALNVGAFPFVVLILFVQSFALHYLVDEWSNTVSSQILWVTYHTGLFVSILVVGHEIASSPFSSYTSAPVLLFSAIIFVIYDYRTFVSTAEDENASLELHPQGEAREFLLLSFRRIWAYMSSYWGVAYEKYSQVMRRLKEDIAQRTGLNIGIYIVILLWTLFLVVRFLNDMRQAYESPNSNTFTAITILSISAIFLYIAIFILQNLSIPGISLIPLFIFFTITPIYIFVYNIPWALYGEAASSIFSLFATVLFVFGFLSGIADLPLKDVNIQVIDTNPNMTLVHIKNLSTGEVLLDETSVMLAESSESYEYPMRNSWAYEYTIIANDKKAVREVNLRHPILIHKVSATILSDSIELKSETESMEYTMPPLLERLFFGIVDFSFRRIEDVSWNRKRD